MSTFPAPPTLYVVHLEDNYRDAQRVRRLRPVIQQKFNEFYRKRFSGADLINVPEFEIKLVPAKHVDALRDVLLPGGQLSEVGEALLFFILDYFVPQGEQQAPRELCDCEVEGMKVHSWLHLYFPAVPVLLLTHGMARETRPLDPLMSIRAQKTLLRREDEFGARLNKCFDDWYCPHFWERLYGYSRTGVGSWHTPGHNRGNAFSGSVFQWPFFEAYKELVFTTDVSVSVSELGDLSEPDDDSGLSRSQRRAAEIFGAKDTFFITNGSSTSNKALLLTLLRPGETVLLDRNCHKSVHQAVVLSGANPVYLPPAYNSRLGIWLPISLKEMERHLRLQGVSPPRLLVLTTSTYEGLLYPVRDISDMCAEYGILFVADEAWAPHTRFHPEYIGKTRSGQLSRYSALDAGADFVVHSTHKALAAFSQASMLHVSWEFQRKLEQPSTEWEWLRARYAFRQGGAYGRFRHELIEGLRYWHSTSPHYPMMATLDLAGIQMRLEGTHLLAKRMRWVNELRDDPEVGHAILDMEDIVGTSDAYEGYFKDPLKLVIRLKNRHAAGEFKRNLMSAGLQWEKAAGECVEFLVTIGTTEDNISVLQETLRKSRNLLWDRRNSLADEELDTELAAGQVVLSPREAALGPGELVPLQQSLGRIAAQFIVPYPPGIPVLLPGLSITPAMIEIIAQAIREGGEHSVHGLLTHEGYSYIRVAPGTTSSPPRHSVH